MSISAEIRIQGFEQLNKELEKLKASVSKKVLRRSALSALTPVVREAKRTIRKGSRRHKTSKGVVVQGGFASRRIKKKARVNRKGTWVKADVSVASDAFYAVSFIEPGTKNFDADPWLQPSFDRKRGQVLDKFAADLDKQIRKVKS